MAASQDHYCQREIEEMTVLRNVDFSVQAVTWLVFVTLNEFGVTWSVWVQRKWKPWAQPQDWSRRLTALISLFTTHLFSCSMNQRTCFVWVMLPSHGEEGPLTSDVVCVFNTCSALVLSLLYYRIGLAAVFFFLCEAFMVPDTAFLLKRKVCHVLKQDCNLDEPTLASFCLRR